MKSRISRQVTRRGGRIGSRGLPPSTTHQLASYTQLLSPTPAEPLRSLSTSSGSLVASVILSPSRSVVSTSAVVSPVFSNPFLSNCCHLRVSHSTNALTGRRVISSSQTVAFVSSPPASIHYHRNLHERECSSSNRHASNGDPALV